MTKETKESGLAYANEILQDEWAPVLLFWLGFRTFTKQELLELIPALDSSLVRRRVISKVVSITKPSCC